MSPHLLISCEVHLVCQSLIARPIGSSACPVSWLGWEHKRNYGSGSRALRTIDTLRMKLCIMRRVCLTLRCFLKIINMGNHGLEREMAFTLCAHLIAIQIWTTPLTPHLIFVLERKLSFAIMICIPCFTHGYSMGESTEALNIYSKKLK